MAIHYLGQMIVELDHEPTQACEVGPTLTIEISRGAIATSVLVGAVVASSGRRSALVTFDRISAIRIG